MKETTCPLCGKKISIADETTYKQHVMCPYCGGKFSYLVDSDEFSAERLAYAVATCQKNGVDSRYYHQAPAGARMYIGLLFYGKVFKGDLDANLYLAAMRKVEPQLNKRDWQYLLENESDAELSAYYKDRFDMAHVGPSSAMSLHVADYAKPNTSTVKAVAVPRETIPATCPSCGEKITISVDVQDGQRVWCPYCDKKFEYHKDWFDADGEIVHRGKSTAPDKTAERPTAMAARPGKVKRRVDLSIQNLLARIKARHDRKQKKRERNKAVIARIVVSCIFVVSLLGSVAAYFWWQHEVEKQRVAREAAKRSLARYLSNTSSVLSDYYSKYSISVQNWKGKEIEDVADAAKVRAWLDKVEIVQSDIRRLLFDFNECARSINSTSKSIKDLKFEQSDFKFRVDNFIKRMGDIRFDPPVVINSQKNIDKDRTMPNVPHETMLPDGSQPKRENANSRTTPNRPPLTEQERMQEKVDRLVKKLKESNYCFDPDSLKKEDLKTQLSILQEMWDDVLMSQRKDLRPSH